MAKPLNWRDFTVPRMKADGKARRLADALHAAGISGANVTVQVDADRFTLTASEAKWIASALVAGLATRPADGEGGR